MGVLLADAVIKSEGQMYRSKFLDSVAFGSYNRRTAKNTAFDWLSRDEKEVEKYLHDKHCGFLFTANGFKTLFSLLKEVSAKVWYNTVPAELPILLISGDKDPVGEYGKGVTEVYKTLRKTGHTGVMMKLYPGSAARAFKRAQPPRGNRRRDRLAGHASARDRPRPRRSRRRLVITVVVIFHKAAFEFRV